MHWDANQIGNHCLGYKCRCRYHHGHCFHLLRLCLGGTDKAACSMKNKALAGHRWCAAVRTTSIGELDGPQYKACYLVNTKFRQTSQTLRSGRTGLFQTYTPEEICITKQKLKTNKQNRKQAPTIFFSFFFTKPLGRTQMPKFNREPNQTPAQVGHQSWMQTPGQR